MHGTHMHDAHAEMHLVWVASAHGEEVGDGGSERRNGATPAVVEPQPLPLIAAMIERPVRIGKQPLARGLRWMRVARVRGLRCPLTFRCREELATVEDDGRAPRGGSCPVITGQLPSEEPLTARCSRLMRQLHQKHRMRTIPAVRDVQEPLLHQPPPF